MTAATRGAPSRPVATAALGVEGVTVGFGGVAVLTDVSLAIAPGQVLGLIGPNGAGKTTLFDVVSGLRTPTTGRIVLDGEDVTSMPASRRATRGLRRTFQQHQVFAGLSVEDNVLAAMEWEGVRGGAVADVLRLPNARRAERERRARVDEVLALCGLSDVRRLYGGSLPIGTARLVELARAVVNRPKVLLLDEPTSGLGAAESGRLAEAVQVATSEHTGSVLLVEHDVNFVMETCDQVAVLQLGHVIATGAPDHIRSHPEVRKVYLG